MADTVIKGALRQKLASGNTITMHPETEADLVSTLAWACVATKTTDTVLDPIKTYYTRAASSEGAGYLNDGSYKYTAVASPTEAGLANYYEVSNKGSDKSDVQTVIQTLAAGGGSGGGSTAGVSTIAGLSGVVGMTGSGKTSVTTSGNTITVSSTETQLSKGTDATGTSGLTYVSDIAVSDHQITLTKSAVQDGSTSQKGVIQLQDSVDATTTKAATPNAVKKAIEALDVSNITANLGAGKTITALSETDGKIAATASDISITSSQVSDLSTTLGSYVAKSGDTMTGGLTFNKTSGDTTLTVGNISSTSNGFGLTVNGGNSSGLLLTGGMGNPASPTQHSVWLDGSGNIKVYSSAVSGKTTIDGTDIPKNATLAVTGDITTAINNLDVSDITGFGAGKTLSALSETDGKISATFQDISITSSQVSDRLQSGTTAANFTADANKEKLVSAGAVKTYVENKVTSGVEYLGTVASQANVLAKTTAGAGDWVRASAAFTFNSKSVHAGDLLICNGGTASTVAAWDIVHTEADTDTNTEYQIRTTQSTSTGTGADIVLDSKSIGGSYSAQDTIKLKAGSNVSITAGTATGGGYNNEITIAATNTTYGAEKGISLTSGKFGHSNTAVTAVTTNSFKKVAYDAYGHITGSADVEASDITGLIADTTALTKYLPLTGGTLTGDLIINKDVSGISAGDINIGTGSLKISGGAGTGSIISVGQLELGLKEGTTNKSGITINTGGIDFTNISGSSTGYYKLPFDTTSTATNRHTLATEEWVTGQGYKTSSGVTAVTYDTSTHEIKQAVDGGTATKVVDLDDFASIATTTGSESVSIGGNTLNVVTIDTTQTISGAKTFNNSVNIAAGQSIFFKTADGLYMPVIKANTDKGLLLSGGYSGIIELTGNNPTIKSGSDSATVANVIDAANNALRANQNITINSGKKSDDSTDITGTASGTAPTLGDSGITAGTYSAIKVNAKGIAVAGGQMLAVVRNNESVPANLAEGGWYFQENVA